MKNILIIILFSFLPTLISSQNSVTKIEDNRFIERKENKYGVTDSLKNIIIPFKYDFIEYQNRRLIIRKNKLNGLFSVNNEELIPIEFEFILPRKNDRFILWKKGSLNGLCDNNGKILIPINYKELYSTENDDFYITENEKNLNGVYDVNGIKIIPEEYNFYTIDNYRIFATKNSKPQIIDLLNSKNTIQLDEKTELVATMRHYSMGESLFQIIKIGDKYIMEYCSD